MVKKVFIDGNLLVKSGCFYGLNYTMFTPESYKEEADEIITCNEKGIYEVAEDSGSMFTTYYVKGGITMYGENGSGVYMFSTEHSSTYAKFKKIQEKIMQLLDGIVVPIDLQSFFYQQQYISLMANFEYFLYNTFMWGTCQCYDCYKRVIELFANSNMFRIGKADRKIFKEGHNILQEKTFLKCVKEIVYHHEKKVKYLYKTAFCFDVNLDFMEGAKEIRNDIVHRAGYSKTNEKPIMMLKRDVLTFKEEIDELVDYITHKIQKINEAKK